MGSGFLRAGDERFACADDHGARAGRRNGLRGVPPHAERFGAHAPRVGAIAVMIDSNDTASGAEAMIGDLMFARALPKG